jgi:hypothetical protein
MENERVTIGSLLDNDTKKQIADKLFNGEVTDIIIMYKDKKDNEIKWNTTIKEWPMILGLTEILSDLVREEYAEDNTRDL